MTSCLFPPPLRKGASIRIIAPGGQVDRAMLEEGAQILRHQGFEPTWADHIFEKDRYFAGTILRRRLELADAIADPTVHAVWAARGGYGTVHAAEGLDIETLRANPKWLIGFSDITVLHSAWARARLCSIHGANVVDLVDWIPQHRERLFATLKGGAPAAIWRGKGIAGKDAVAEGPIFGGNLTVLASLVGTGQSPMWDNGILFIEEVGERPYRLHRCITQLRTSGLLTRVRGVVVGQLTDCDHPGLDYTALDMLIAALAPLDVPILHGLDVGHEASSHILCMGRRAVLDPCTLALSIDLE